MVLDSQVFVSNKTNDTERDSLEKLRNRVNQGVIFSRTSCDRKFSGENFL